MPRPIASGVSVGKNQQPDIRRSVVLIGEFEDPSNVDERFRGIGNHMTRLVQRSLAADRRFDARIDPHAGRLAANVLDRPPGQPAIEFNDLARELPDADYIVIGRVSDFHHTGDLTRTVARRGWFGQRRNEAVAALDVSVIDLQTRRVSVTEEFVGIVSAGKRSTDDTYRGVSPDSYLFRSTPLGAASQQAVDLLISRLEVRTPLAPVELRIVEREGRNRVHIAGGRQHGISAGQQYYVYVPTRPAGGSGRSGYDTDAVYDPAFGEPLVVRIDRVYRDRSTGWLLGQPPEGVDLTQTVLNRRPPRDRSAATAAAGQR